MNASTPELSSEGWLVISFNFCTCSVGIFLNGFVVLVLLKYVVVKERLNFTLIVNQTLIDFTVCGYTIVRYLILVLYYSASLPDYLFFKHFFCIFLFSDILTPSLVLASTVNLVLINLERYLKVVHPRKHMRLLVELTIKRKTLIIFVALAVWIVSFLLTSWVSILFGDRYNLETDRCEPTWSSEKSVIFMLIQAIYFNGIFK